MSDCFFQCQSAWTTSGNLGYFLAETIEGNFVVCDLIFPTQSADGTFVEDHGINGSDTSIFLQNLCEASAKFVLGWVHTHVRGTPVCLSGTDCHTQYLYSTHMFPNIKAFVIQLPEEILDCFELTEIGFARVSQCSVNFPERAVRQHQECSSPIYYSSLRLSVEFKNVPFNLVDGRKTKSFTFPSRTYETFYHGTANAPSSQFHQPIEAENAPNQFNCVGCSKFFTDSSKLSRHLKQSKCRTIIASDNTASSNVLSKLQSLTVESFLKVPCVCCGSVFENEQRALQHFSRSSCKSMYKTLVEKTKRKRKFTTTNSMVESVVLQLFPNTAKTMLPRTNAII